MIIYGVYVIEVGWPCYLKYFFQRKNAEEYVAGLREQSMKGYLSELEVV